MIKWILVCIATNLPQGTHDSKELAEYVTETACLTDRDNHVLEAWRMAGYPAKKTIDCSCPSRARGVDRPQPNR